MRAVCPLLVLFFALPAHAAEEEVVVAFEPAYGHLFAEEGRHGAGGSLTFGYGLTGALWMTASAGAARQLAAKTLPAATLYEVDFGLTAALDVLRTIPFVEVLIGLIVGDVPEATHLAPTVRIGAGADYLVTPNFSLGGVIRWRPISSELGESYLTAQLRVSVRVEL